MRQPTDPDKLEQLRKYHIELLSRFLRGKLDGKVTHLMRIKANELRVSLSVYYERNRKLKQV